MILRAAERRPQIVVIEDLHWIDRATEEFLAVLGDSVPASPRAADLHLPARVRAALRRADVPHAHRAGAPLGAGQRPHGRRHPRQRCATRHAAGRHRRPRPRATRSTSRRSCARCTKPARFASRTAASCSPRALDDVVIPDTIHDVIMARIDRLDEAPKRTLQTASVIGRDFTRRLVERLSAVRGRSDALLRELRAVELIYEKSVFPEVAYRFKHALTQDVAYRSLLLQRRRELHGLIGAAIEELYADRLTEHYEVLAHHFSLAEDWRRAFDYLLKAAEKAAAAFALRDALALYDQALAVADHLGDALPRRRPHGHSPGEVVPRVLRRRLHPGPGRGRALARARRARRRSAGRGGGAGVDELCHHVGAGLRRRQRLCAPRHRGRRRRRRPRRGGRRLPHDRVRQCPQRPPRRGGLGVRRGAPHQPPGARSGARDPHAADAERARRLARRLRARARRRRRGGPSRARAWPARPLLCAACGPAA